LTLSKTQESQILDLYLKGFSQRRIAKEIEVCLDSVNNRLKLFRVTGSIHKRNIQRSRYNPVENATRQRIRYYLSLEKRKSRFTVNQLYDFLVQEGYEITKSKVRQWIKLERNRLKDSFLDIFYEPGQMVQFDWGSKKNKNFRNK
jgi:transposase